MLQSKTFDGKDPDEVYNMSTDVFVVDTPWLIEKLKKKPRKNTHKSCAISCVIWRWNTMLLPMNIQAT